MFRGSGLGDKRTLGFRDRVEVAGFDSTLGDDKIIFVFGLRGRW